MLKSCSKAPQNTSNQAHKMKSWLLILGAAITLLNYAAPTAGTKRVVCYYGSWSSYYPGEGRFEVEDIDPNLCTHAIYAFVGLDWNEGVRILDSWSEIQKGGFRRFNELKQRNPEFKTMVAMGGWNEGSISYSAVVNDPAQRANFVKGIVRFVKQYGFDGFDLDWEYPAQRGGAPSDKDAFSRLLEELRTEFDKHGLLLSAAVVAGEASARLSYHIPDLGRYLDFINIMTYDLHGSWESVTGHNAPLYPGPVNDGSTVDQAIQYWIREGAPSEKINVGIGTYGHTFTLSSSDQCVLGAPAIGAGLAGPYTGEAGSLGYNEICEHLSTWNVKWDDQQRVPYACKGNQFVGYDDIESSKIKAEYAVQNGLGGVMIWTLATDDFRGKCHENVKYPLLTAINRVLFDGVTVPDTTTAENRPTDPPEPSSAPTDGGTSPSNPAEGGTSPSNPAEGGTSPSNPAEGGTSPSNPAEGSTSPTTTTDGDVSEPRQLCTQDGFIRDPSNWRVFYLCQKVDDNFEVYSYECPAGLAFDTSINVCNWEAYVTN